MTLGWEFLCGVNSTQKKILRWFLKVSYVGPFNLKFTVIEAQSLGGHWRSRNSDFT